MRISSVVAIALLASGCTKVADKVAEAAPENRIECAVGGKAFDRACAIEPGDKVLTVRHADGGFRRFDVAADRTLTTADGAEVVEGHALPDGRLEIAVGGDRYRLPKGR